MRQGDFSVVCYDGDSLHCWDGCELKSCTALSFIFKSVTAFVDCLCD